MSYVIVERGSWAAIPYAGPVCQRAGIEPGKLYDSPAEAERHALILGAYHPAGSFIVLAVPDEYEA